MTVSELIEFLEQAQKKYGDKHVISVEFKYPDKVRVTLADLRTLEANFE